MQTQYMDCIKVSDPINHADAGTGFQLDIFNLIKPRRKPHEIEGLFSPAVGKFKKTCGYRGAPCNHNATSAGLVRDRPSCPRVETWST